MTASCGDAARVDVAEGRRLLAAATDPTGGLTWITEKHHGWWEVYTGPLDTDSQDVAWHVYREADARLMVWVQANLPALLDAAEAVKKVRALCGLAVVNPLRQVGTLALIDAEAVLAVLPPVDGEVSR